MGICTAMTDVAADSAELGRQLEAVSRVSRAVARAGGLQSVLVEVIEAATRLCNGEYGSLHLLEGDVLPALSHSGSFEHWEYDKEHPHTLDRSTMVGRAAVTREVVHIPDVDTDPEYAYAGPRAFRVGLGVPILFEDELIGVMGIIRRSPEPFAEEHIELVQTFADQAAIAITNARLLEAVERQLEQQRAISVVLGAVARGEGLDAVFEAVVEAAARLCSAEYGQICIADGDLFRWAGSYGASPELVEYEQAHPSPRDRTTVVGRVGVTGDVVHIPDVLADSEYSWEAQKLAGFRAMLGVPIVVEDELIGVINVVRNEPSRFTEEDIALVKTFADQAAIAIAHLLEAVERQRTELSRFVSPQIAELISSDEGEKMLAGHRANISVVFCDLRGFTSFTETAEPEELFEVLGKYHAALGKLIHGHEGTLEHFAGDGVMVFFNDPVPVDQHELTAIRFALAAHERFGELADGWRKRGHNLGLGIGISAGYATLGRIGFEGRYDYGALGTVTNLASRLSASAEAGQTLIGQRVFAAVEDAVEAEPAGELELKGFREPVPAYRVLGLS